MTVTSTTRKNSYVGTGTTGPFSYGFRIFAATDLVVKTTNLAGTVTTLSYPADYSVTGVGLGVGGSITLTNALTTDWALTIERIRPLTQETDIRNHGAFFAETHEDVFDDLVMIDQQQQADIDRSFKAPTGDQADISSFNAGYYLRVNLAGTGIEGVTQVVAAQNFLQSGAGAVIRSANSKMADIFSVKDFGATGDGVTNDTVAIALALTALQAGVGGVLYFPPGTYAVTAPAAITSPNITVMGAGADASSIVVSGNGISAFTVTATDTPSFQNIAIVGPGAGSTVPGIIVSNTPHGFVQNVKLTGFHDGISCRPGANSSYGWTFVAFRCYANTRYNIELQSQSHQYTFLNCVFGGGAQIGLRVIDSAAVKVAGGDCEGVTVCGIDLDTTLAFYPMGAVIEGGFDFESNTSTGGTIRIGNSGNPIWGVTIIGINFTAGLNETTPVNAVNVVGLVVMGCLIGSGFATSNDPILGTVDAVTILGNRGMADKIINANGLTTLSGTGSPETAVTASIGALYLRRDGGANTTLYIKESGSATNTGWVAK